MIRYSTNWMGPVSIQWYRDRGLTKIITRTMVEDSKITDRKKGEEYSEEVITELYSTGRIDIRGMDRGGDRIDDEYGLAPMRSKDWYELSNWLDTVETDFVWKKEDLLYNFERFIGRKIEWNNNDE